MIFFEESPVEEASVQLDYVVEKYLDFECPENDHFDDAVEDDMEIDGNLEEEESPPYSPVKARTIIQQDENDFEMEEAQPLDNMEPVFVQLDDNEVNFDRFLDIFAKIKKNMIFERFTIKRFFFFMSIVIFI